MPSDTRSLHFESSDDAQRWRVFHAVEEAAAHAATQQDLETEESVFVRHPGGEYTRSTVTEAKAVAERNGYKPFEIHLHIRRTDTSKPYYTESWVTAQLYSGTNTVIGVSVDGDNEVEVNGAFALIESAVNQAKQQPAQIRAVHGDDGSLSPKSWWSRLLSHPYSVQIIGGASAALVVAVVTALWATFR